MLQTPKWYDTAYKPLGWDRINVPGYWEDAGIRNLDGIVWYRRELELPHSVATAPATLYLGRIVDADIVYVNGQQVGQTSYQYPQRRYTIPDRLLKPGRNIITVRVTNQSGKGGFVPDKPYHLSAAGQQIDLTGYWQYKVGEVFLPHQAVHGISVQNAPAALFNAMVAPYTNYAIKGVLWYQGESNASDPAAYAKLLPAFIIDWRNQFRQNNLPFVLVQLPNFLEKEYLPSESNWALMREAQANVSLPYTATVVTIDLGEWNDIHPDNKKDVGIRSAFAARKIAYGDQLVYSGPQYASSAVEEGKMIIHFQHTGGGLVTRDGDAPGSFAIAGADGKFVWAETKIEGGKVIAWNSQVKHPVYVRYAWADNPHQANLYNKEGLPAAPFRTDTGGQSTAVRAPN
jgi:sialate O-acetylesterase